MISEDDIVEMARLVPSAGHQPDPDDVVMPPDVEAELIARARTHVPEPLLETFDAGVRVVERERHEHVMRLALGGREALVVPPEALAELSRWAAEQRAPPRPELPPPPPGVPGNRRERRARAAQRRRR